MMSAWPQHHRRSRVPRRPASPNRRTRSAPSPSAPDATRAPWSRRTRVARDRSLSPQWPRPPGLSASYRRPTAGGKGSRARRHSLPRPTGGRALVAETSDLDSSTHLVNLVATCTCTSAILIVSGAVVCASCRAPIVAGDARELTTRSPAPGITPRVHREWCASGRVVGAWRDADGSWHCTLAAWNAARHSRPATDLRLVHDDDDAVLDDAIAGAGFRRSR